MKLIYRCVVILIVIQASSSIPQYYSSEESYKYPEARYSEYYDPRQSYEDTVQKTCSEYERFYPEHGRCYMINTQGPCKPNMKFYASTDESIYGVCDCNNEDRAICDSPFIYFAPTDTCYRLNSQGPCLNGNEWIVWDQHRNPSCQPITCPNSAPPSPFLLPPPPNSSSGPSNHQSSNPQTQAVPEKQITTESTTTPTTSESTSTESSITTTESINDQKAEDKAVPQMPLAFADFNDNEFPLAEGEIFVECGSWVKVHGKCWKINTRAFCSEHEILNYVWSAYDVNLRHVFEPGCVSEASLHENKVLKSSSEQIKTKSQSLSSEESQENLS